MCKTLETVPESWQSQCTTTFTKSAWDCIQTLTKCNTDWVGFPHYHCFCSWVFQLELEICFLSEAMFQEKKYQSILNRYFHMLIVNSYIKGGTATHVKWYDDKCSLSELTDLTQPDQFRGHTVLCSVRMNASENITDITFIPSYPSSSCLFSLSTLESLWWPRNV